MKKQYVKLESLRSLRNSLNGDARDFADAVIAAFEEAAGDEEVEHTVESLKAKVDEIAKTFAEKNEEVAERIQKLRNEIVTMVGGGAQKPQLTKKVANEVARAILNSRSRVEVRDNVEAVLTRNGITGLEFDDITDFALNVKVEDLNPLYAQLKRVPFTRFFYGAAELTAATSIARQWNKLKTTEKAIQALALTPKKISTDYIYKRQQIAQSDLDDISEAGQSSQFLEWITNELYKMVVNTIVMSILVGDTVNEEGERVTTFEGIGSKTTSDAFTTIVKGSVSLGFARSVVDKVYNPDNKKVVALMSKDTLTALAKHVYAEGGTENYLSKEEVAAQIGADEIITTDVLTAAAGSAAVVAMIPEEYWVKEKNEINVAYPTYEKNVYNIQREVKAGGAIHGLLSTAVGIVEEAE